MSVFKDKFALYEEPFDLKATQSFDLLHWIAL